MVGCLYICCWSGVYTDYLFICLLLTVPLQCVRYAPAGSSLSNIYAILANRRKVYQNPRRLSTEQKRQANEIIDKKLCEGIVIPNVNEYGTHIVIVKKKVDARDYVSIVEY
ncbi:hypothetical protein PV327_010108 [Microctonus hyperodae]|uniref:Uncharacterized protein n=1 Tax=Microctonus hyperodae TaxID=165561 RepID=A0AA39KUF8_MICHY|nr:hypothetical protein PV327_010108 [Microctonus hyperodae]